MAHLELDRFRYLGPKSLLRLELMEVPPRLVPKLVIPLMLAEVLPLMLVTYPHSPESPSPRVPIPWGPHSLESLLAVPIQDVVISKSTSIYSNFWFHIPYVCLRVKPIPNIT